MSIYRKPLTLDDTETKVICCDENAESVVIPDGVKEIGGYAFKGCIGLTSIVIPNSVTSIGDSAFKGCTGLTSIVIPNSVTEFGHNPFANCGKLKSILVASDSAYFTSVDGILFSKDMKTLLAFPGNWGDNYTIPSVTSNINEEAFSGSSIQSVIIGEQVKKIGYCAFINCTCLKELHLQNEKPENIEIGGNAFMNLDNCTLNCTLYIPNGSEDAYRHDDLFNVFKEVKTEKVK